MDTEYTQPGPGRIVVVSGPSGVGKTTVMRRVLAECPAPLTTSISATTRPPRPEETPGVDYFFLTPDEFQSLRKKGEFLEAFEVFGKGHWYGTLWSQVRDGVAAGKWIVLSIDVQGALTVMETFPDAVSIFLRPRRLEQLERRLRGRGTETEEALRRRLDQARSELAMADRYRHQVVNDDLDRTVREICDILIREWENAHHA
ncbi:MAG: guanylate kinase [Pirellulales bacterium]|nr:guanylate kinase [Pirellulales bacterium]